MNILTIRDLETVPDQDGSAVDAQDGGMGAKDQQLERRL